MKKLITLLVAFIMVFTLCVPAFAAEGSFVQSPGKTNPEVTNVQTDIPNYDGRIIIVPYDRKTTLPADESNLMDRAYDDIAGKTHNGNNLGEVIDQIAKDNNTTSDKLGVSDLFNVRETNVNYNSNGTYTITVAVSNVGNFQSLIYRDKDGVWHTVPGAKLSADGKYLTFTTTVLSVPYAFVVEKTGASPKTGDTGAIYICFALVSSAAMMVFLGFKLKSYRKA